MNQRFAFSGGQFFSNDLKELCDKSGRSLTRSDYSIEIRNKCIRDDKCTPRANVINVSDITSL